jgi:hypothetical protein
MMPQQREFTYHRPLTFTERVAQLFEARIGQWIPAIDFEAIGGRQAWRTRISECRQRGMPIENRIRWVRRSDGSGFRLSEYRLRPGA